MKKIKKHLNQFGLVAAALGFIFGHTASEFIASIVGDAFMPAIGLMLGIESWENHTFSWGTYSMQWGMILKDGIRLLIVATLVIWILQWLQEHESDI